MKHAALLTALTLQILFASGLSGSAAATSSLVPMERETDLDRIPLGPEEPKKLTPEDGRINIRKEDMTKEAVTGKKDPLVMITDPRTGVVSRACQTVSGKVGGGIAKAYLRVNEDIHIVSVNSGAFEARCALRQGVNSITVLAWDLEGNIGKDSLTVFYAPAKDGPQVRITSHKNGDSLDVTGGRVITVEAVTGDRAAAGGSLVINNVPRRVSFKDGAMKQEVALLPDTNEIYVEVEGSDGRTGTSPVVRLGTFDARPKDLIAVLTWESATADLDLHVWDSFGHHTFNEARDPYQCDPAIPAGLLDMDKKGDYGPEVFSLAAAEPEVYTFYVKFSPGMKKGATKAHLRLLLHGDEPSLRTMRWLGPAVMGDQSQVWEAAHVKMPEGIFFQEKDLDLVKTLGMDMKAVKRLALMLDEENPAFRLLAISAMGQVKSEDSAGPLLKALAEGTPEVRRAAAGALWNIKSVKSVEGLVAALGDADPEVRRASAGALGGIGDTRALYYLNGILTEEADTLVRVETIRALGRLGDPRALDVLLAQARDADARVRVEAVRAMGELRAEKAEDMLRETLRDNSQGVRELAAWALGRVGLKTSVKPLTDALYFDDCEGVRVQAAVALGRINDPASAPDLRKAEAKDGSPSVRYSAAKALEGMTPSSDAPDDPTSGEYTEAAPPAADDEDLVYY